VFEISPNSSSICFGQPLSRYSCGSVSRIALTLSNSQLQCMRIGVRIDIVFSRAIRYLDVINTTRSATKRPTLSLLRRGLYKASSCCGRNYGSSPLHPIIVSIISPIIFAPTMTISQTTMKLILLWSTILSLGFFVAAETSHNCPVIDQCRPEKPVCDSPDYIPSGTEGCWGCCEPSPNLPPCNMFAPCEQSAACNPGWEPISLRDCNCDPRCVPSATWSPGDSTTGIREIVDRNPNS